MIRYALKCACTHAFESWFRDSAAYDDQRAQGLVCCPACNSTAVDKAIMAPRLSRSDDEPPAPAHPSPDDLRAYLKAFRAHVEANADHVGPRFAEEARKIHFGETESRAIYGDAHAEDIRALLDDGVPIAPLPKLPADHN